MISVDGGTGEVVLDAIKTVGGELGDEVEELLAWADRYRTEGLGVRANADTPDRRASAPVSSAPKASGSSAPSTCSSRPTASRRPRDDHGR